MFTVFFARVFIKEPILPVDFLNLAFILVGMVLVVKPPFLFGHDDSIMYNTEAIYALVSLIFNAMFVQSNIFVTLRLLKGKLNL